MKLATSIKACGMQQRLVVLRVDGSAVTTSAAATGLAAGFTDATIKRGTGADINKITIDFLKPFAQVPEVVITPVSDLGTNAKTATGLVQMEIVTLTAAQLVVRPVITKFIGYDTTEGTTTAGNLKAASHAALAGDLILMTSGTYLGQLREVASVTTDNILLGADLAGAPGTDTFEILRPLPVHFADFHVHILGVDGAATH